jgi:hypothetical protein
VLLIDVTAVGWEPERFTRPMLVSHAADLVGTEVLQ